MHRRKILIALIMMSVTILACTSVSQFVGMPDRNDPGLSVKELEDDSMSAGMNINTEEEEKVQDSGYQLTPEEKANEGLHTYSVESTSSLGAKTETLVSSHVFSEDSVDFVFGDYDAGSFVRVAKNTYEKISDSATDQLIYTATGFEYHSISTTGFELHNICTLQD